MAHVGARRLPLVLVTTGVALTCVLLVAPAHPHDGAAIASVRTPVNPLQLEGDATTYENLLALIPDTAETREQTTITDYSRIRQQFDIAISENVSDPVQKHAFVDALLAHSVPLGGVTPPFLSGLDTYARLTVHEPYLGFRRLDLAILAGRPPQLYEAVGGHFDPEAAERAITDCADCPPPVREQFEQVPFYSWGGDFQTQLSRRFAPPVFDSLGRGGRIAITQHYVLRTVWTEGIEQMITAWQGGGSLRESESYRLMARGFARSNAYNLHITDNTQGPEQAGWVLTASRSVDDPERQRRIEGAWNPPSGVAVLEPYVLVGAGTGRASAGEPFTAVVLVHATERAAQANIDLLRRRIAETSSVLTGAPWSEQFSSVEIVAEGSLLVAILQGAPVGANFLLVNDPLLLHR